MSCAIHRQDIVGYDWRSDIGKLRFNEGVHEVPLRGLPDPLEMSAKRDFRHDALIDYILRDASNTNELIR
jgi:hypothetical protein